MEHIILDTMREIGDAAHESLNNAAIDASFRDLEFNARENAQMQMHAADIRNRDLIAAIRNSTPPTIFDEMPKRQGNAYDDGTTTLYVGFWSYIFIAIGILCLLPILLKLPGEFILGILGLSSILTVVWIKLKHKASNLKQEDFVFYKPWEV